MSDYPTQSIAVHFVCTNIMGMSSMRLHRELGETQKTAWFLLHRIRETFSTEKGGGVLFEIPMEIDECYVGGLKGNKQTNKKLNAGHGSAGKSIVHGIVDRATNLTIAKSEKTYNGKTDKTSRFFN